MVCGVHIMTRHGNVGKCEKPQNKVGVSFMIELNTTLERVKDNLNILLRKYDIVAQINPECRDWGDWLNKNFDREVEIICSENIPVGSISVNVKERV